MKAVITIKLIAESQTELINTFGGSYRELREQLESDLSAGLPPFVHPDNLTLRWLVATGRWEPPVGV